MLQSNAAEDIFTDAARRGDAGYFPMPAGQSAGLIADMPSASEVVRNIVEEARAIAAAFGSGWR
jgi:NAD(P)H-dependent flavin oxidoreductase YrpB (nitropropane dioxygenase family)